MKIKYLKDHISKVAGTEEDVSDGAANYLIRVGVAEEVIETFTVDEPEFVEKVEKPKAKEKKENKTGNVPTAKKRKLSEATIEGIEKDHNVKIKKK